MVRNQLILALDAIALNLSYKVEELGYLAVPIPSSEPYDYWDSQRRHGRGILSLKHAAQLASLGSIGKNTLLINNSLRRFPAVLLLQNRLSFQIQCDKPVALAEAVVANIASMKGAAENRVMHRERMAAGRVLASLSQADRAGQPIFWPVFDHSKHLVKRPSTPTRRL
jgi:hypothetical protein